MEKNTSLLRIAHHRILYGYESCLTRITILTEEFHKLEFVAVSYTKFKQAARLLLNKLMDSVNE